MMKTDIADIYREAWRFLRLAPLLFLIPALVEFAQHVVEWQAGMYDGIAGAKAAEADPLRLHFGFAKTLALLLPTYWFARYILFAGDIDRARRIEWPAVGLWFVLFAVHGLQQWWTLFGPSVPGLFGLAGNAARWTGCALTAAGTILGVYLTAWGAAWAVGNAAIGPIRSIGIMAGSFWATVVLTVAGVLPLMVLHYALSFGAILGPAFLDWPLLILDTLVVGYLALAMAGAGAIAARRAAARKQVALVAGPRVAIAPVAA